jgi:putative peptidoglycan lipid II flippase
MPSKQHLLRRSMVVGSFSFLGSLTGILVEITIAAHLGLSRNSDTFYIAYTVPYIITNLISATGQFSLVPFFSSLEEEADSIAQNLWQGLSYALNLVALGLVILAVAGTLLAPWVIRGIAPGFTASQSQMSAQLARWLFFVIVPAGVAEVFRSFLFSQHRFALGSAAGFFRNVSVIAFIVFGFHRYGDYSIVMGYFAGYLAQVSILGGQVFWSFPVRYRWMLRGLGKASHRLHGAGASQIASALGWQAVVLVERIIASFLPPGTITALNYGFKIMTTIAELVAGSIGTSSLPALSRAFAREDEAIERKTFQDAIEITLVLLSPIAVCCLVLPHPIMQLVFQRGNFSSAATGRMAFIFFCYSLSLLPFSGLRLLNFYLFARHEMKAFLGLSALYTGAVAGLDLLYVMVLHWGAKGIPLALLTSLGIIGLTVYSKDLAGIRRFFNRELGVLAGKDLIASLLAAIVIWRLSGWIHAPQSSRGLLLFLCVVCGIGCAVFLAVMIGWRAISASQILKILERPAHG